MSSRRFRRVAVLVSTDDSWGRSIVESIGHYARHQEWRLLIAPRDEQERLRLPQRWDGDGVIASIRERTLASHLKRVGLPTVDVSITMQNETWLGRVATDDKARAEMAVEHFRARRILNLACYAPAIGRYPDCRAQAFENAALAVGLPCHRFVAPPGTSQGWEIDHHQVTAWLAKLPRPLGVFASDPYPARQLAEICDSNNLRVPDEIAILSGDNDDLLCNLAWPPLSSVQLDSRTIGHEAAKLLTRLMDGEAIPTAPLLIPPLRVCSRQSTDIMAIDDEELQAILRYISNRASAGVQVKQILRDFPISRRSLEQRFRSLLGRSPAEEIRRVRLELAQSMLLETESPIATVALACGFATNAHFTRAFQKQYRTTPSALRATLAKTKTPGMRSDIKAASSAGE